MIIRGLGSSSNEDTIFKYFKANNIRIVQIKLLENEMGNATGIGFVLCVNLEEKRKALDLGRMGASIDNKSVYIEEPRKK